MPYPVNQKTSKHGRCHICGVIGPLSYEHVPPEKAFNNSRVLLLGIEDFLTKGEKNGKGIWRQRGQGGYTLCERCNNSTGQWYGGAYVDFAKTAMYYRQMCPNGTIALPFHIYPLRVIKQIVTMFFSVNNERFSIAQPKLAKFALDKYEQIIPDDIRIYAAYYDGDKARTAGIMAVFSTESDIRTFSEISFPPFVFVMALKSQPIDLRLLDITDFSDFSYYEKKVLWLPMFTASIFGPMPGDFRSAGEIEHDKLALSAES